MKNLAKFSAAAASVFVAFSVYSCSFAPRVGAAPETAESVRWQGVVGEKHDYIFDGMAFNSANIMARFYYGDKNAITEDGAYYIVYDDIDAGIDYECIRVTAGTYQAIMDAEICGDTIVGNLQVCSGSEPVAYEFTPDTETI